MLGETTQGIYSRYGLLSTTTGNNVVTAWSSDRRRNPLQAANRIALGKDAVPTPSTAKTVSEPLETYTQSRKVYAMAGICLSDWRRVTGRDERRHSPCLRSFGRASAIAFNES